MAFSKKSFRILLPENISYDLRKYYIKKKLEKGAYDNDEKEMNILSHLIKPGDIVLDLGANIGVYTRMFSKLTGRNGQVHAFEAMPGMYGYFIFNMKNCLYNNIITHNVAVGDKLGLYDIVLPDIGMEDIYQAGLKRQENACGQEFTVPMVTLDSFYTHCFNRVDFIKCYVEGAELLVFRGAKRVLSEMMPKVICEVSNGSEVLGASEEDLFKLFKEHGYKSLFYDGKKIFSCEEKDDKNTNPNYIFFHCNDTEAENIIEKINAKK